MTFLVWLFRALLILLVVRFVVRMFAPGRPRPVQSGRPRRPQERLGGTLVRCATCGTHVPQDRALSAGAGAMTRHFCSSECQQAGTRAPAH
jgi:hypothetical protein